jgi:hypothetical protein
MTTSVTISRIISYMVGKKITKKQTPWNRLHDDAQIQKLEVIDIV